jgi:transposase
MGRARSRPPGQARPGAIGATAAALLQSPTENGFGTGLWTLKRVGTLIKRMYGVEFGQTQIWRILGALGFQRTKA